MYVSGRSHPLQNTTCFQAISEHCVGRGILHPNTTWCLRPCMIAFSGLNLLVRFNHSKYVHTKIKLTNRLGIFLYFPCRYSSRTGNCPFANSQRYKILGQKYCLQITTKINVYGFMKIFTACQ